MALTNPLYNFMEQMNQNPVRTQNLFEMSVHIPDTLKNNIENNAGSSLTRFFNPDFTFYGQGFQLPSRTIQYANVGFKGFPLPVPTMLQMGQDHTVTINADIEGNMRRAFLAWQAITINPTIAVNKGYFEGNRKLKDTSYIWIRLLNPTYDHPDDAASIVEHYTIYGVTVEEVGTMQLSNTEANIATFDVKFKSQYWQYGEPHANNREDRSVSFSLDNSRSTNGEFKGIN